jgi:hypothetical protein
MQQWQAVRVILELERLAVAYQPARSPARMAQPRAKRTIRDWTLSEKIWLLDYFDRNPRVSAKDLGQALADHINS